MDNEISYRLVFLTILTLSVTISGYYRKKARDSSETIARRTEGGRLVLLRIIFTLPLLLTFLFYIFIPGWLRWSSLPLPPWARWSGAALGILCFALMRWVFLSIGNNISETVLTKKEHQLVTHGPYRWVRHPLYATALLLLFGLAVLAANWFMLLLWLTGVLVFRFVVIPIEENNLIKVFGEKYTAYQGRTGALAPRLLR